MVKTGYVFEELYMWHDTGSLKSTKWIEPTEYWENPATKRRLHNLLAVSGVLDQLTTVRARRATEEEILRFHTKEYHDRIMKQSKEFGGEGGDGAPFTHGTYDIACLSAGGVLAAVEAVLDGKVDNAYVLARPPGHHAERDRGMGFCMFGNVALGALHARVYNPSVKKIAIIDYDVHHGNGTQQAFWDDADCLFISLHQDNNYPQGYGGMHDIGGETARGANINIPLPPGCGEGAYRYAFEEVVLPALRRFAPEFVLVSSGFDANYMDPLGAMGLSSESFGYFAKSLCTIATDYAQGRIVFAHEGGYSKDYVPFCGLRVIEAMADITTSPVEDLYAIEAKGWAYQALQPHQKHIIDQVAILHQLKTSSLSSEEEAVKEQIQGLLQGLDAETQTHLLNHLLLSKKA